MTIMYKKFVYGNEKHAQLETYSESWNDLRDSGEFKSNKLNAEGLKSVTRQAQYPEIVEMS